MGSHSSKAGKGDVIAQDAAAAAGSPSKSNGQENGHVKINGDVSPQADGEATPLNGNGSAEPVKEEAKVETGSGDAIEPAPVAEDGDAKPDGASAAAAASKETSKKKKKFSFKKSFKLSGISFRKAKKESGDASAVSSPSEEQGKAEAKGEENPTCAVEETEQASTTKEETPEEKPAAPAEAVAAASAPAAAESQQEAEPKREEGSAEQGKEEEKQQPPGESPEDTKPEETSKPAEVESSPGPGAAAQKEE
ncbi:MARCKS-related protein [Hemicordylus capensis]|uniref:MARCKS-related protein n=1 Tax=Hemicordylus capensis TaxID=884348 RepID=UPI0023037108|nr:MARCKS-related protein [Hemicordylus capensis]